MGCDDSSLCQNGATECFHRPLSSAATAAEGNYVCDCSTTLMIGHDCNQRPPALRTDMPDESFQTCYGNDCSSGYFQSINYPMDYIDRWMAVYLLYIPGATRISFTFNGVFGIESFKDELYVGTGLTFGEADISGTDIITAEREVRLFDNTTLNGQIHPPQFSFESDSAWFYFKTDHNIRWSGWNISWEATVDQMPPTIINCPSNIERTLERGQPQFLSVTWTEPSENDASPPVTSSSTHNSGDIFFIGTTRVTYAFFDRLENSATCSFDVTILEADTVPPVISNCPMDISREVELGTMEVAVSWTEPTATDLGTVTLTQKSHIPGTNFPAPGTTLQISTTTVFYIFSDDNGNSATCTFTVSISAVDTTPPTVINCPSVVTEVVELGQAGIEVSWDEPIATDASEPPAVTVVRSRNPGDFFTVGETTVTYTFTDSSSNTATCTFTVQVQTLDTTPPTISGCPGDITENVELGTETFAVFWIEPTARDASGAVQVLDRSHMPGTNFPVDQLTTVIYQFSDNSGNVATCTFTVLVISGEHCNLVVKMCPNSTNFIICGSEHQVSWTPPYVLDSCEIKIITRSTHLPGEYFKTGSTTVLYTFEDEVGNTAQCNFQISVQKQTENCHVSTSVTFVFTIISLCFGVLLTAIVILARTAYKRTNKHNLQNVQTDQNRSSGVGEVSSQTVSMYLDPMHPTCSEEAKYSRQIIKSNSVYCNEMVHYEEISDTAESEEKM